MELYDTTPLPEVSEPLQIGKDLMSIAIAHNIPYAATASPSYAIDYLEKVHKAAEVNGPSFIHVLTPCAPGWGFPSEMTIEMGRLSVESRVWQLLEYEKGQLKFTHVPGITRSVSEYFQRQARFRRLKPEHTVLLQKTVDGRLNAIERRAEYLTSTRSEV